MFKKKMAALMAVLLMTITICSTAELPVAGANTTYAEEKTNLVMENEKLRSVQTIAGEKVHMTVELRLKDGYCSEPEFHLKAPAGSPLSFENLKVKNGNDHFASWLYIDSRETVVLEYDVVVNEFAKINTYSYDISYDIPEEYYDEDGLLDDDIIEPGNLSMEVFVVNEMIPPQLSIVEGTEHTVQAGETVTLDFTLENQGELKAMDIYVEAEYEDYDKILIPQYTPLRQKVGALGMGQSKDLSVTYKIADEAKTERIKLPVTLSYKMADGTADSSVTYLYLYIEGTEDYTNNPDAVTEPLLLNSVKQSPSKPMAGEKMTVSFYLENVGTMEVKNIKIAPTGLSSSGFEPINSNPYQHVTSIPAGQSKKIEIPLKVGKEISEGLNTLSVQYSYETGGITKTETEIIYILDVQNPKDSGSTISRPKLMISNFYTDVEEVKAGNVFDFTFELLNTNDSIAAKNIKVTVSGSSNTFSVTAGGNSFFVSEIKPQETAPITINLKASAAATTGAYPIQIKMEYEYEGMVTTATYSGEVVEEEILLQVKENLRPSVENVYVGSWDTPYVNQPTAMNFEFYNMGKSTLNNTYVTIEGDFMLSNGSNSYYIGNISAGMPEYIEFDVVPLVEGNAVGKMIIHMEDSNGDEVTMEKEFTAYVMGEMSWEDPGMMDPGYMDPGYMDPGMDMPVNGDTAKEPILSAWWFFGIQAAILIIVIPTTRAICLAVYRRKIKMEDAI